MAASSVSRLGAGKVCLLTGGSSGLGKASAFRLAAEGFHLFLACRNEAKTLAVRSTPLNGPAACTCCTGFN